MDKWREQLDSARRIGPGSTSHEVLTVVLGVEFRKSASGKMFSMAESQPAIVWTNGGHSEIQRIK